MGFQSVTLLGNIGTVKTNTLPSGDKVVNFTVAINTSWTGNDGQKHDKTTWWSCAWFGQRAEKTAQYIEVGREYLVIGTPEDAETYVDRDGNTRVKNKVRVTDFQFTQGKGRGEDQGSGQASSNRQQAPAVAELRDEDIPF